jgi:RNA polymerase sigma-70 factor (ECF subfamily)
MYRLNISDINLRLHVFSFIFALVIAVGTISVNQYFIEFRMNYCSINEDIINGLQQGDTRAVERMMKQYYAPLCIFAKRYVGTATIAEEVVSDVMYKVWQNRQTGYHADTFREYLYTAVRNTAINYMKQEQNRRELTEKWAEQLRYELIEETPLDTLMVSELQARFGELMASMPEQRRKAYQLSRTEGLTYNEIADRMQISVNTVKLHIKTALLKLRDELSDFLIWICLLTNLFF